MLSSWNIARTSLVSAGTGMAHNGRKMLETESIENLQHKDKGEIWKGGRGSNLIKICLKNFLDVLNWWSPTSTNTRFVHPLWGWKPLWMDQEDTKKIIKQQKLLQYYKITEIIKKSFSSNRPPTDHQRTTNYTRAATLGQLHHLHHACSPP